MSNMWAEDLDGRLVSIAPAKQEAMSFTLAETNEPIDNVCGFQLRGGNTVDSLRVELALEHYYSDGTPFYTETAYCPAMIGQSNG